MSVQNGKDLLLKIKQSGSFTTVAGLKSRELEFNRQLIDITDSDSTGHWRELQSGGVRRARLRGEGIFRDATSDAMIRRVFFEGTVDEWQVILPDFGQLTGHFVIVDLSYAGTFDGEIVWHISLESAGEIVFIAI